jgi:hypothetical protein
MAGLFKRTGSAGRKVSKAPAAILFYLKIVDAPGNCRKLIVNVLVF